MPYADPDKQRAFQRDYQRARRAGQPGLKVKLQVTPAEIRTAHHLLAVLGELLREVLQTETGDIFVRARCAGYLIGIGLRCVEVADLEARIQTLEERLQ